MVGSQLLEKLSRRLVKMRNSTGIEGGGEKSNTKSVDVAQNTVATQMAHRVIYVTIVDALLQEMKG